MIYVLGIGIALLMTFLLFTKKNKNTSDIILTAWMFIMLVHLALFYLSFTGALFEVPFLLGLELPLPLLHGIFLFLYVSSLTEQMPSRRQLLTLHFLPPLAAYGYLLISFIPRSAEEKIATYMARGSGYDLFGALMIAAITLSGITYVTWSALILRRHERSIRDQFSELGMVDLRWLRFLIFGLGGIWTLVIFQAGDDLIYIGVVGYIFLMGFFGIRQTDIFARTRSVQDVAGKKEKYQRSGLSHEASEELHQRLVRLMTEASLYKKSELSIDELAQQLGVHPNHLSQVINQREGKNFFDFVNSYRIAEFKRLVSIGKHRSFTLLSLAYECGFSSKTSFNRCFRKATGQTPSEYVAAVAASEQPA